jgi:pyridoxamine 5'-phosphate oxidase-like protein
MNVGTPRPEARRWAEFEAEAPAMAAFVRDRLEGRRHRLMATIRADGWPRISGTELLIEGGELWVGGMPASRKFDDLRREPRVAIHSGPEDPPDWVGDARVSGLAVLIDDEPEKAAFKAASEAATGEFPEGPFELMRLAITEVSTVRLGEPADHLVLQVWRPGQGVREIKRS